MKGGGQVGATGRAQRARGCRRSSPATNCVRALAARPPPPAASLRPVVPGPDGMLKLGPQAPCSAQPPTGIMPAASSAMSPVQRQVEGRAERAPVAGMQTRGKLAFQRIGIPDAQPAPAGPRPARPLRFMALHALHGFSPACDLRASAPQRENIRVFHPSTGPLSSLHGPSCTSWFHPVPGPLAIAS